MGQGTPGQAQPPQRPTAASGEGDGGAVDGRVRRSRSRVLTTAFDLLSESGVGGFTVDEVARRSGVAKTTIYRHWPSREALVIDAASRISAEQEVPDTGSLEGDVTAILANLGYLLSTARWSSVVPSIVDVAERDPEFAGVHGTIQRGHAAPLREVIERAAGRGLISAAADPSSMVSALIGPLYYRRWFSREPIDDQFIQTIVRNVISSQRATDDPGPGHADLACEPSPQHLRPRRP
jgi:AcrR family transcriptional regulator